MTSHPTIPVSRRRQAVVATLLLVTVLAATIHVTAAHDRLQCPCGVLHAHCGVSIPVRWAPPPPPPLAPAAAPEWESGLSPRRSSSPFRPLRAPPGEPITSAHLPA